MSIINILDKSTIDKIAAGEVVERPSSVVKELLENAIDANSTAITIEIKDGGISYIRITDNGKGIAKDDIKKAFMAHATSKISSAADLLNINSLGFRGEALSSISAVSMVECLSKTPNELVGIRYVIEGGEEKVLEDIGAPVGTTFIIRNLFYNTPARKKFLKTATTEGSYISTIVERLALSHPEISIRFINNGQTKLHTSGNNKLKDIIYSIYGRDISNNIIEINEEYLGMKLKGYVGKPIITKGNRNNMVYFINGRYIKSKVIFNAIEEAYKPFIMQHNYPFTMLHFTISPEFIDVNVHPSKMEIRFINQMEVYNFYREKIRNVLTNIDIIPKVSIDTKKNVEKFDYTKVSARPLTIREDSTVKEIKLSKENNIVNLEKSCKENNIVSLEKSCKENNIVNLDNLSKENNTNIKKLAEPFEKKKFAEENKSLENIIDEKITKEITESKQLTFFDDKFLSEKSRNKHKMIGQLFDTYWLIEYDNNLYIIDQHAAHEKVLYEEIVAKYKNKEFTSQQLNPPIILTLSLAEADLLEKYMSNFNELGYEIENYGGREFAVRAVPDNLYSIGSRELLMSLIDNLNEDATSLKSDMITDKIASMSCKAAVKGNNRLSIDEADELITKLLNLENPYNCPHGRPTIISMSKYELEKKFKRII